MKVIKTILKDKTGVLSTNRIKYNDYFYIIWLVDKKTCIIEFFYPDELFSEEDEWNEFFDSTWHLTRALKFDKHEYEVKVKEYNGTINIMWEYAQFITTTDAIRFIEEVLEPKYIMNKLAGIREG
jgi:hypothetical protein